MSTYDFRESMQRLPTTVYFADGLSAVTAVRSSTSSTCIYCGAHGPHVRFTREHVIPTAFCAGFRGALVLPNAVCATCNEFFGETIDLALARDGPEGFERYRWGVRSAMDVGQFRSRQLDLKFTGEGHFSGVRLRGVPADVPGGLATVPMDGAIMESVDGSERFFFTAAEIEAGAWRDNPKVDWRRGVRIFGANEVVLRLRDILITQGVSFASWEPFSGAPTESGEVEVEETATLSSDLRRAYAKITFNYLTVIMGADFVLSESFDPIRRFVRDGVEVGLPRVYSSDTLPFQTGRPSEQRPLVHFLSLGVAEEHRNLLGIVMLFGYLTHTVLLAESYGGPWPLLPRAHMYNVQAKNVEELQPAFPRFQIPND